MVEELLARYDPSGNALFDWLRQQVDDSMLYDIAMADYGDKVKQNLQALKQIRDTGIISVPLDWVPAEVIHLTEFSQPDVLDRKPRGVGNRGHLMRAFCCTISIKAALKSEDRRYLFSGQDTTIQLVASALVLGPDPVSLTLRFLCRLLLSGAIYEGALPFYALMILFLALSQDELCKDGIQIKSLAQWVLMEEYRQRNELLQVYLDASEAWILNRIFSCFQQETLKNLARTILLEPIIPHPCEAASILNTIGKRVVRIERR